MATRNKEKIQVESAVESAVEYLNEDTNKKIDDLISKIQNAKYAKLEGALVGIMHNQVAILKLMKK